MVRSANSDNANVRVATEINDLLIGAGEEVAWKPIRRRLRVLLAEDDHDVRLALSRLLEFFGYGVSAVANGAEMLDLLASAMLLEPKEPPPDVIITDVRMPGVNGLSIVEGLRANGWKQPVIVISAFGDDAMRQRIRKMEHTEFFPKPFDPDRFARKLSQLTML